MNTLKRYCINVVSQHLLKTCAMQEPLICSNRKSQFLDKKEKKNPRQEWEKGNSHRQIYVYIGGEGVEVNCQRKWERVCKIKTSWCSQSKKRTSTIK